MKIYYNNLFGFTLRIRCFELGKPEKNLIINTLRN